MLSFVSDQREGRVRFGKTVVEAFSKQPMQGKKVQEGGFYMVVNDNLEHFFNAAVAMQLASRD